VAVTVLVVVVIALVMLVVLRARPGTEPFDPESGRPDGTRGLVLLLGEQGVTVDVVHEAPTTVDGARLLVLDDRLDDAQRATLDRWITAGGVAVVADARSPLVGDAPTSPVHAAGVPPAGLDAASQANLTPGDCTVPALHDLRGVFVRDGVAFRAPPGTGTCFTSGQDAFVVSTARDAGVVVAVGDNELWTNALLRYADNAPLATALLAPERGGAVHLLVGDGPAHGVSDVGAGEDTLADLVRPGVWMALVQLATAFVVFALARGVRVGRPVDEPLPAPVEGSELVVAAGQLMQRARHTARAGWILRGATYRDLCRVLRVPTTTPIAELDRLAAGRGLAEPGQVRAALDESVDAPDQLVALADRLAALRERADHHHREQGGP
jgi:hypothetical protein